MLNRTLTSSTLFLLQTLKEVAADSSSGTNNYDSSDTGKTNTLIGVFLGPAILLTSISGIIYAWNHYYNRTTTGTRSNQANRHEGLHSIYIQQPDNSLTSIVVDTPTIPERRATI